jgi:hypothetical protein
MTSNKTKERNKMSLIFYNNWRQKEPNEFVIFSIESFYHTGVLTFTGAIIGFGFVLSLTI